MSKNISRETTRFKVVCTSCTWHGRRGQSNLHSACRKCGNKTVVKVYKEVKKNWS